MNRKKLSWPIVVSYWLASSEMKPTSAENEVTATQLWANWAMDGLVINEESTSVGNTANRTTNESAESLINIANAGPARCFNYFGAKALKANVILGFILKRVDRAELAALTQGRPFKDEARRQIANRQEDNRLVALFAKDSIYYKLGEKKDFLAVYSQDNMGRELHPRPFQLVPYCTDTFMGPTLNDLSYPALNGADRFGIFIEVGCSVYPITQGQPEDGIAGMIDESRLASAGQLHVQVNIETHI